MSRADDMAERGTAFDRIVCVVDPRVGTPHAAGQAVDLAAPATELTFLAIAEERSEEEPAGAALDAATRVAAEHGVAAAAHRIATQNASEDLIEASRGADLLAVDAGTPDVWIGGLASAAVHTAPLPVLVAREAPEGPGFPELVLVATDGSSESTRGLALAARIAVAHRSRVALIQVDDGRLEGAGTLAEDGAALARELGGGPVLLEAQGNPAAAIAEAAGRERASLIVIGSRGLGRARVLGSVGERLAHEAPCSVLVLRESAP